MSTIKRRSEAKSDRYSGGHEKDMFSPWVYALHDIHKNRKRTLRDVPKFLPTTKTVPEHILTRWMNEVEQGTAPINPKFREFVRQALDTEAVEAVRDALIANAKASKKDAEDALEDKVPKGGVVSAKYHADAAGFLASKYHELRGGGTKQQPISIGALNITAGEPRRPRAPKGTITEVRTLRLGDSDTT